jgi:hypothetical protein
VAEIDGKILAIGGMNSEDEPSREVAIFDVNTRTWSSGPDVPGAPMNGFGCSACVAGGALYLSGMDGRVYRLSGDFRSWKSVGVLQQSRFFHRLLPAGTGSLLAIGGASPAGHLDTIERFLLEGTE